MLQKALKRLSIARRPSSTRDASDDSGDNITPTSIIASKMDALVAAQTAPFLHIPADILVLVLKYLSLVDTISLSLTTKGLRHLCPSPQPTGSKVDDSCIRLTHLRLLPPARHKVYKCPYCLHDLCPPSCSTALLLDSENGVFIPSSLFPVHNAEFHYISEMDSYKSHKPQLYNTKRKKKNKNQENCTPNDDGKRHYSTIWCEHHRCPKDLFVTKPSSISLSGRKRGYCQERFYYDYYREKKWKDTRLQRNPDYKIGIEARWLAGYRPNPNGINASSTSSSSTLSRVYEKSFYDSLCLHCFLPLRKPLDSYRNWFGSTCECCPRPSTPPKTTVRKGCITCRPISVKVQAIEAFDNAAGPGDQYINHSDEFRTTRVWLYLMLPCKAILNPHLGKGIDGEPLQRLITVPSVFTSAQSYTNTTAQVSRMLEIVRGYQIIPATRPTYPTIPHLPRAVLRMILLHLPYHRGKNSFDDAERASYAFGRGMYFNRCEKDLRLAAAAYAERMGDPWVESFFPLGGCLGLGGF